MAVTGPAAVLRTSRPLRVLLLLVTLPLPVSSLLSGALVVWAALLNGTRSAGLDALAGLACVGILVALTGAGSTALLAGAAVLWGSALLGGHLLARHRSLDLAVQLLVGMALLVVLIVVPLPGDPATRWGPVLTEVFRQAGLLAADGAAPAWLPAIAALMPGLLASSAISSALLAWLVGSWMAVRSGAPTCRNAFLGLRLGRVMAVLAVVAGLVTLAGGAPVAANLLLVLVTGFVGQGLAVIHWQADSRRWPGLWPLALYGPLLLLAPLAGLILATLALVGFADNWTSLRRSPPDVV